MVHAGSLLILRILLPTLAHSLNLSGNFKTANSLKLRYFRSFRI